MISPSRSLKAPLHQEVNRPEVTPGGSESTPVTSQEAGNKRRREEHALMGRGSAYRGEGEGPPSKKV